MDMFPLFLLLLLGRIQAAGAKMELSPEKLTVLRGDEARFTCSTHNIQWTIMIWSLNWKPVLTISNGTGVLHDDHTGMTAEEKKDSPGDWVFVLKNTERDNQGVVTCHLQNIDSKTSNLFVQEKGSVKVFRDNELALKGHSVLFMCQAEGWFPQPTLKWQVDNKMVSQSEYNISSEESGKGLFTVTSYLNVTAVKSSSVDCLACVSALPTPVKSSVRLTVVAEVVQDGDDCTVPLAVTSSLTALLLLLLLCICTVLCYRQRRQAKPSAQETIWFSQSGSGGGPVAGATGGQVNLGYTSEFPTDPVYNELIMGNVNQMDFATFTKVPDVVSSSSWSLPTDSQTQASASGESCENVRRITTV